MRDCLLGYDYKSTANKNRLMGRERARAASDSRCVKVNVLKISSPVEGLQDVSLVVENVSVGLNADLCEVFPPLEVLWIALVAVCLLRVFPVTLTEVEHRCDLLVLDVVNERARCSGFCYNKHQVVNTFVSIQSLMPQESAKGDKDTSPHSNCTAIALRDGCIGSQPSDS